MMAGTDYICVFGTGSEDGKSTVAAGLCRLLSNQGVRVAPFKAQNMSNNSAVVPGQGEMGRAQYTQALAARVEPDTNMNPILLKPTGSEKGSQLVVQGTPRDHVSYAHYYRRTEDLFDEVLDSLETLSDRFETIVIEGAGSCAELNLRDREIANFRLARELDASVLLVSDISHGGVFARVLGTLDLLEKQDRSLVQGIIINKFRGDTDLFEEGQQMIENRSGIPVLGLLPELDNLYVQPEDSLTLDHRTRENTSGPTDPEKLEINVIRFPRISNFTDFEVFRMHPDIALEFVTEPEACSTPDVLVLPGSKNVRDDLKWLKDAGWKSKLEQLYSEKTFLLGICGGYQMLGKRIADPQGVEGSPGTTEGLGFLDVESTLKDQKVTARTEARRPGSDQTFSGYEIHMGRTRKSDDLSPMMTLIERNGQKIKEEHGVLNVQEGVGGCYLHGLFDNSGACTDLFRHFGLGATVETGGIRQNQDESLERLAGVIKEKLDLTPVCDI